MNRARMLELAEATPIREAYGDDPIQVLRNGMLGVARKRKYKKIKDKAVKQAKIQKLVSQWQAALNTRGDSVSKWLIQKLD